MKVGILTFHCAHNYGAVLQCYALQETLKSMGYEVEVIDYRPDFLLRPYVIFSSQRFKTKRPIWWIKNAIKEISILWKRVWRFRAFQRFIENYLHLSKERKVQYISDKYDAYILGSDQIWNSDICNGELHPYYFANFPFPKGDRKYIAYAVSMGKLSLKDVQNKTYLSQALMNFDAVSVREYQLLNFLKPFVPTLKIEQVLDPTILADTKIWEKIAVSPRFSSKYVLLYQVREDEKTLRIAQQLSEQIQGEVIQLTAWVRPFAGNNVYQCTSPEGFLGWIKNATCVVTTSFHGSAFSVIFNRPFYCVRLNDGADDRTESLLRMCGLEHRMINKNDNPEFSEIDYTKSICELQKQKEYSRKFLVNALNI